VVQLGIIATITGRNSAVALVDDRCGKTSNREPFAYDKLGRVRTYLKASTIAEADAHFTEAANDKP
jgi:hypothetical protein